MLAGPDSGLLPKGELRMGRALAIAFLLVFLDLSQHRTQALVGDDVGLVDARLRVDEHAAGQKLPFVAELDASVLVLVNAASLAREEKRLGPGLDEVGLPLVVEGEVLRELALLLPGEDPVEVLGDPEPFLPGLDLVVYCTPLKATGELLRRHRELLDADTLVTDVVSLKTPMEELALALDLDAVFVGSHPMTGGEGRGFLSSREGLFIDAKVWIVPGGAPDRRQRP